MFGRFVFGLALLILTSSQLLACPLCGTETGQRVWDGIWNDEFAENLVLIALPFPVMLGIIAAVHFGVPGPASDRVRGTSHD